MNKLITMNGLAGASKPFSDIRKKSDTAAGLVFFSVLTDMYPGLTWQELFAPAGMQGAFWRKIKNATSDIVRGTGGLVADTVRSTGNIIGSVVDKIGKKGGETVRLVAEPEVQSAITRGVSAYATGGQSEALYALSDQFKTKPGKDPVTQAGAAYKTELARADMFGGINPAWVMGGAGALILVVLLAGRR